MEDARRRDKNLFRALLALAALASFLAMAPCLDNGFTNWDEYATVVTNPRIKSLAPENVARIFSAPDLRMYTPLATLSYALNYRFAGLEPRSYHAVNLSLHAGCTVLVMLLARLLLGGAWAPFLVALLFGIHPAHVESVAWAAERKDMLSSFFYLASLTAYAAGRGRLAGLAAAFVLFLAALLAKPMAVTLPAALLLIDWRAECRPGARRLAEKVPFFLLSLAFSFVLLAEPGNTFGMHWAKRLLVPLYNLGFYARTLLWPFDLSAAYIAPPGGRPAVYLLAALAAAGLALLWKYFRRDREAVFGAAFYVLLLLPVLQFFPFGPVISADRYTYLSSIGFFWLLAAAARRLRPRLGPAPLRALAAGGAACALLLLWTSRARCAVWKDGVSLWTSVAASQPPADYIQMNLCDALLLAGRAGEAGACVGRALELYPGNPNHHYNACRLFLLRGEAERAAACFSRLLEAAPGHARALAYLGDARRLQGRSAEAERLYALAAARDPSFARPLAELARAALARGDRAAARDFALRGLAAEPADGELKELLKAAR